MRAAAKYMPAKIQMTPETPIRGRKSPTIAGPRKVLKPEPKFIIDMAAPCDSGAKMDMMAAMGTNPRQRNAVSHPCCHHERIVGGEVMGNIKRAQGV
jgi:hypothetical protein